MIATDLATPITCRAAAQGDSTRSVHAGDVHPKPHHSLVEPIFQTATYTFDTMADAVAY